MTQATASADELRAWLKLTMTPQLGPAQAMLLLSEFGLPQQILDHSVGQLSRHVSTEIAQALKSPLDDATAQLIEHTLQWVQAEDRSEEHTSELQSRGHLVCRLLLEKKKETR